MPKNDGYQEVPIDSIELDTGNPRIAHYLSHYVPPYKPEEIELALESGGDDQDRAGTSFAKLRQSIQSLGRVVQPIILQKLRSGKFRCVEGNTRVFLYAKFKKEGVPGQWDRIPAVIHELVSEADVHAIRLQAHLVGPRQWDPYSKAKYLDQLRNQEQVPFSELVDLCGGNKRDVVQSLDAYSDMEQYYRPLVKDEGFDPRRFSAFVELQNASVKRAISEAGFTKVDFSKWIQEGKFKSLQTIRSLPLVLSEPRAREVFLEEGMERALKVLDKPQPNKTLDDADLESLSRALHRCVGTLPFEEFCRLKDNPGAPTIQYLQSAREAISNLMKRLDLEE